jgi:hypothetical protein
MTVNPITSEQQDQFRRFVEVAATRALKEDSPDKDGLQRLIMRGGEFQTHVVEGIHRFSAKQPDYTLAQSILGTDFITPEEVANARGIVYSAEQLELLAGNIPPAETLRWLKDNDFPLMPCPPDAKSILDVRAIKPAHFYSKEGGWYTGEKETFARDDKTSGGWLAIRKTPVPKSTNKNWDDQQKLLSGIEHVPNAAEVGWFVTTYFEVRGVRLLENVYVRTSSRGSGGSRVVVGRFDSEGLGVGSGCWDGNRDSVLGVASARKL